MLNDVGEQRTMVGQRDKAERNMCGGRKSIWFELIGTIASPDGKPRPAPLGGARPRTTRDAMSQLSATFGE